jgi:hypothetical protein
MKRILSGAAALILVSGSAGAQSRGAESTEGNTRAGTSISTGGVSLPLPKVEIIPTPPGGFVGAVIESPPPSAAQDRPGISGLRGSELRPDLNGGAQMSSSGQSGAIGSSGVGRPRPTSGSTGSEGASGLGAPAGAIDEQRGTAQQQLRGTSGEGLTASEGQRPNRVLGDRMDARQNRLGSDATGSVSGASSLGGRTGSGSTGLGGSIGGAGRSSGGASRGGSSGGGSGGGG